MNPITNLISNAKITAKIQNNTQRAINFFRCLLIAASVISCVNNWGGLRGVFPRLSVVLVNAADRLLPFTKASPYLWNATLRAISVETQINGYFCEFCDDNIFLAKEMESEVTASEWNPWTTLRTRFLFEEKTNSINEPSTVPIQKLDSSSWWLL